MLLVILHHHFRRHHHRQHTYIMFVIFISHLKTGFVHGLQISTTHKRHLVAWISPGCFKNNYYISIENRVSISSSILIYNTLSGSDHNRSHSNPWSGTSVGLIIRRICSILCRSGLRPPWQQKIFSSTIAATGRQLKQSVNVFQSLILYRLLPANNYS